jgi:hypothetical protein
MTKLTEAEEYLNLIREESNVKEIIFNLVTSEKGKLKGIFNGSNWRITLDDQDVTKVAPRLLAKLREDGLEMFKGGKRD